MRKGGCFLLTILRPCVPMQRYSSGVAVWSQIPKVCRYTKSRFRRYFASILPRHLQWLITNVSVAFGCLRVVFYRFLIHKFGWVCDSRRGFVEKNFQLYPFFRQYCEFPLFDSILPLKECWDGCFLPETADMQGSFTWVSCWPGHVIPLNCVLPPNDSYLIAFCYIRADSNKIHITKVFFASFLQGGHFLADSYKKTNFFCQFLTRYTFFKFCIQ